MPCERQTRASSSPRPVRRRRADGPLRRVEARRKARLTGLQTDLSTNYGRRQPPLLQYTNHTIILQRTQNPRELIDNGGLRAASARNGRGL
jgi:hypothetical protein